MKANGGPALITATDTSTSLSVDELPQTNVTTFRWDLHEMVAADLFDRLDQHYCSAAQDMASLCDQDYTDGDVGDDAIADCLMDRFADAPIAERVCIVRGAQAGALGCGVLLNVNFQRLVHALSEDERQR